jgi:hypothetical protein
MNLGPWHDTLNDVGLTYVVPALRLPARTLVLLSGNNGVGKTLFLERLLIPHLHHQGLRTFHLAQDLTLQRHALAASLAAQGHAAPSNLDELIRAWCTPTPADVLILDEADRHLTAPTLAHLLAQSWHAAFVVSHGNPPFPYTLRLHAARSGNQVCLEVLP